MVSHNSFFIAFSPYHGNLNRMYGGFNHDSMPRIIAYAAGFAAN